MVAVYCDKSQIYCDKSHSGWISNSAAVAIVGDNIGYLIGCALGLRLLMRYAKYSCLNELRLKVGHNLFLPHGGKILFFGRFLAMLSDLLRAPRRREPQATRLAGPV
jgi:membrane protein DedA with SNARE-associated domain